MGSVLAGVALVALLAQTSVAPDPTAAAEAKAAQGDLAGAAADYKRLLGAANAPRALVLFRLANLERQLKDPEAALAHTLESAALFQQAADLGRASEALNLAATIEIGRSDYVKAAGYLGRAVRTSAQAQDWARHAQQVTDLASVHFVLGQYDDAQRGNHQALAVTEAHQGDAWAGRLHAMILANQAALHQRLGRYQEALTLYREAPGATALLPQEQAQMLVNEGALFRRLGDPYKALQAYDQARTSFALARSAEGDISVLTNRGIAMALDLGRVDDAVESFTQAEQAARTARQPREEMLARLYRGETLLRGGVPERARADFEAVVTTAQALGAREEEWKARYGLGRVELLAGRPEKAREALDRAIAVVDALREGLSVPSTRAEFFQDKRVVYDARIAQGLTSDTPAALFALVERSRARAWRERMKLDEVTLAGVQARLPAGTVLLAYWWSPQRSAVIRVTRADARVTPLTVDIDLVTAFADALRRPDEPRWSTLAADLGRALIPDGLVSSAAHLVIIPDGALGAVPFEALTVDGAPLVAHTAISYLPTAAMLALPSPSPSSFVSWRSPWTKQLAAFGDPLPGSDRWSGPGAMPRLAASAEEVRNISATLGGQHQLFVGRDNRKGALVEALVDKPVVVHLATHGAADLVSGERSRLIFSPAADGEPAESLFLREVYGLPFGGVDLAVLSACETDRGPDVRGEGVQGFGRALLAAGAARAVTTLWRVPDAASAELMRVFYDRLQRGDRADDALAGAKRALLASGTLSHPHYWAAFVLTGNAGAMPRALRWRDLAGVTLVATGVVALGLALRRRSPPAQASAPRASA